MYQELKYLHILHLFLHELVGLDGRRRTLVQASLHFVLRNTRVIAAICTTPKHVTLFLFFKEEKYKGK
jgi:hypothetical protein